METSIVKRKFMDGSTVHAVVFVDGTQKVDIVCSNEDAARALSAAILYHAVYATIEAHRP